MWHVWAYRAVPRCTIVTSLTLFKLGGCLGPFLHFLRFAPPEHPPPLWLIHPAVDWGRQVLAMLISRDREYVIAMLATSRFSFGARTE